MNIAQLVHMVPAAAVVRKRDMPRLGPRRVAALAAVEPDASYALQELLRAVQDLAQGGFQGAGAVSAEALALAADLTRLGAGVEGLLRPSLQGGGVSRLDAKA
ncbi:MAG: hypothetical protein LBQ81_13470 [Zoogloeaceae bacterium]|jgi:hypothetical protein|nr:hypothetical protein [Zoogloeaceae bacterium]